MIHNRDLAHFDNEYPVLQHQNWSEHQQSKRSDIPPPLVGISNQQLSSWLPRFVVEARNQKGEEYNGSIMYYSLCAGVQRFVREDRACSNSVNIDIFKDMIFAYFRSVLDSVLKELHAKGIGTSKKRAEVIPDELEEQLWEEGILGDDTPDKLLDTLVYCLGLQFALRSGREHRNIRPDMIEMVKVGSKTLLTIHRIWVKESYGRFEPA